LDQSLLEFNCFAYDLLFFDFEVRGEVYSVEMGVDKVPREIGGLWSNKSKGNGTSEDLTSWY